MVGITAARGSTFVALFTIRTTLVALELVPAS
jgi:hypothetical protein